MSDSDPYTWLAADTVTEPFNGLAQIYINHWWITDRFGRVCLHRNRAPQCNSNREIAAIVLRNVRPPGATTITHIPVVYLPHRCDAN